MPKSVLTVFLRHGVYGFKLFTMKHNWKQISLA